MLDILGDGLDILDIQNKNNLLYLLESCMSSMSRPSPKISSTSPKISLPEDALSRLKDYTDELVKWNEKINLVSFKSYDELVWRHIADSLVCLKVLKTDKSLNIVDLGSGAGLPGMVLKIANPNFKITLIESIAKKCSFFEHIKKKLGLTNIEVINERLEKLGQQQEHRQKYEIAISRALCKTIPNLELALPLLKRGGKALIYKSRPQAQDIKNDKNVSRALDILGGRLAETFNYSMSTDAKKYAILIFIKIADTPGQYPRRTGVPQKKPL